MQIFKRKRKPVYAMATINPQMCQDTIRVEIEQRDEGTIPHVHVYLDQSRNPRNCAYIRLDTGTYMENHKGKHLGKYKSTFIKIMESKWNDYSIGVPVLDKNGNDIGERKCVIPTGYQAAVHIWLYTYPSSHGELKFYKNGLPIMPDFEAIL